MRLRELTEGVGRITKQNQTADVGPDEVKKQAAKFGNTVDKDGRPPTLSKKVKGSSTNVLYNLGLSEGYKLQLERDKEMLVLNITDTASGKRTEVRGKPGYETGNYDPNDKLHMLLDKVGKSANISDLMNGEVVGINPKHPDADRAKTATDTAFEEENLDEISAKDIGAGALAGLMALTPVSKAFGQDANTNPLPNKQTSTMVQKDVAGKKDLSKIQAPAEKDFWKVTINFRGQDVDLKLPFSAGTNKKQIKQYVDDMMSENGAKDYSIKDIDTLNKHPIDQSILKKLMKELDRTNGVQSIPYLASMAKEAGAKPGADNTHAIAAKKAYYGVK